MSGLTALAHHPQSCFNQPPGFIWGRGIKAVVAPLPSSSVVTAIIVVDLQEEPLQTHPVLIG